MEHKQNDLELWGSCGELWHRWVSPGTGGVSTEHNLGLLRTKDENYTALWKSRFGVSESPRAPLQELRFRKLDAWLFFEAANHER